jgi:hypothetical protein
MSVWIQIALISGIILSMGISLWQYWKDNKLEAIYHLMWTLLFTAIVL